jgi:hypothetical protein
MRFILFREAMALCPAIGKWQGTAYKGFSGQPSIIKGLILPLSCRSAILFIL